MRYNKKMLINVVAEVVALVFLFLFAISKFSRQMEMVAGERLKDAIKTSTSTPLKGTFVGLVATTLIQSSTAVTVIAVGLVDAGILPFFNSLGLVFGANIGSTITSQLIAFKLTYIAPYIVAVGFLLGLTHGKYTKYGKPLFYFGLVFMSLSLIIQLVEPLQGNATLIALFSGIDNLYYAIFLGIVFTILFQSSAITAGLVLILAAAGLLSLEQAMGIVFGANIGTTSTSLFASLAMKEAARKTAIAHFLFNVIGVVIFLPFLSPFLRLAEWTSGSVAQQIANAHVLFNVISVVLFLIFIKPFSIAVETISKKIHFKGNNLERLN
jgi:phosphate:Na+ symporter